MFNPLNRFLKYVNLSEVESMSQKWVYLYEEVEEAEKHVGGDWDKVRTLLGGKGANLAEMTRVGVPVPAGFTVTTEACNAYLAAGQKFPAGMWEQELEALKSLEKKTGKKIWRSIESTPGFLPFGGQVLDAGDDGYCS
jgi:hypothetical protein